MLELLEARGLLRQDIGRQDLIPAEVLEAAERKTFANSRFISWPAYGTPYQAKKFRKSVKDLKTLSESVLPSRAIRFIRNAVASLDYGIQPKKVIKKDAKAKTLSPLIDQVLEVFDNPNTRDDDFQSFISQIVEDILCFDAGAWEYVEKPRYVSSPLAFEVIPGYELAENLKWDGDPQAPRWMQVRDDGRQGPLLLDRDIEIISMRKRSWTPFGLSPLETVVDVMEAWLGLMSYQRRVASEAYPPILLNLKGQDQTQLNLVRSWWENEIKGRATPGFIGWPEDLQAVDMKPGGDTMLLLAYQEMLVRTISFAFDLKPLDFSIERDVNRTTAEVQRISSLRDGPKTIARQIQSKMNQRVLPRIAEILGNPEILKLEFFWLNMDPADDKHQAETLEILTRSEIMLPDEARIELDLEPRSDGLGMISANALKELYTINPQAGLKKPGENGDNRLFPEPAELEPHTEDNLEQIAASMLAQIKESTAAERLSLAAKLEEFINRQTPVIAAGKPENNYHNVTVNVPPADMIPPAIDERQAAIEGAIVELRADTTGALESIINLVEELKNRPAEKLLAQRTIRDSKGLITEIQQDWGIQTGIVTRTTKKKILRDEQNHIQAISEE